jgi:hypothetical protein
MSHAHAGAGSHGHAGHGAAEGGGANPWNENVEAVARSVDRRLPTEVAFGMADPVTIEAAVRRLEARGVQEIAVVPLFVSSHSPIIGNSRYILRLQPALARTTRLRHLDQVSSPARFRFADAMDAHPLVSEILLERARAQAARPGQATVVLIAHGPNDEEENRLVPVLLSAGGVEAEVENDLRGLRHRFAAPLMPHPNVARWVEAQANALLAQR